MLTRHRLLIVLSVAFVFGFMAAVLKGQGSGLRDEMGNLSAPWLLVAFVSGSAHRQIRKGALAGLAATVIALAGFYAAVALTADLGSVGLRSDLTLAFRGNIRYFAAGVVSGPTLGALGAWCSSRRSTQAHVVVGLLLLGEPIVIALVVAVHTLNRLAGGWSVSNPGPYIGEFVVGLTILALGWRHGRMAAEAPR